MNEYKSSAITPLSPSCSQSQSDNRAIVVNSTEWVEVQHAFANEIEELKDNNYKVTREDIFSIPDIFADVLAMDDALNNATRGSEISDILVNDWRAVITILVLYKEMGLDIRPITIDFTNLTPNDAMFLHAAASYLPKAYNGKITIWEIKTGVNNWVPFAIKSLDFFAVPVKEITVKIPALGELASYDTFTKKLKFEDAAAYLSRYNNIQSSGKTETFRKSLCFRLYNVLQTALKNRRFGERLSSTGKAQKLMTEFAEQIQISQVEDKLAYGPMLITAFADLAILNYGELTPPIDVDKIFLPKIYLFNINFEDNQDVTFSAGNTVGKYSVRSSDDTLLYYALMPLTAQFVSEYGFVEQNGQKVPFDTVFGSLEMILKTEDEQKTIEVTIKYGDYKYVKIYDKSTIVEPLKGRLGLPPVSVWPAMPFKASGSAKNWNEYLFFYCNQYTDDLNHDWTKLSFSSISSTTNLQTNAPDFHDASVVTDMNTTGKISSGIKHQYAIGRTPEFPYFLYGRAVENSTVADIGVLAVTPKPTVTIQNTKHYTIGMDFGTSNTVAYISSVMTDGSTTVEPISFSVTDVLPIVKVGKDFDDINANYFLPTADLNLIGSFPTILHVVDSNLTPQTPIFEGTNIYFRSTDVIKAKNVLSVPGLETELKWRSDPRSKILTRLFLEELCLYCAQKAAKGESSDIEWRFSYPSALGRTAAQFTDGLRAAAESATKRAFGKEATATVTFATENYAAGRGLASNPASFSTSALSFSLQNGFVSIDIGGGSTDISVWQQEGVASGDAKVEASIKFAGSDILTNNAKELCTFNGQLAKRDLVTLWNQIGVNSTDAASYGSEWEASSGDVVNFKVLFDTMLSLSSNNFKQSLATHSAQAPLSKMIKVIAFNIAMLVNLSGSLINKLINDKEYKVANNTIQVIFCGNGARMFDWISHDRAIMKMLVDVFRNTLEFEGHDSVNITFERSSKPKTEVAMGLVAPGLFNGNITPGDEYRDELTDKKIYDAKGVKNDDNVTRIANIFMRMFPIITDDIKYDQGFGEVEDFKDIDALYRALTTQIVGLQPVGRFPDVSVSEAFVRCATIVNKMLIAAIQ